MNGWLWERYKIGQHNAKTRNAADGRMAGHQEKVHRCRNDSVRSGQNQRFLRKILVIELLVHGLCSFKSDLVRKQFFACGNYTSS